MTCMILTAHYDRMNYIGLVLGLIDVAEIIVAVLLAFVVSVVVSIGRTVTCNNLTETYHQNS